MLERILEPEVMDSRDEAEDYDTMDHREVNEKFVADFSTFFDRVPSGSRLRILDVGCGTARIPLEIVERFPAAQLTAIDLAEEMLVIGRRNVEAAGKSDSIRLERVDAKQMPSADATFDAVISNSIVHHIPQPLAVLREMRRVVRPGGCLFIRDLLRPDAAAALESLVARYAGTANDHQRRMFHDSLHAALSLAEVRLLLVAVGLPEAAAVQSSDRHWTIAAVC